MKDLPIIYQDNHLLVVNKPAGIATMGAESGESVHSLAAQYLKQKYNKPGNVYVGIVSRLDAMTSGVLVLARTSKAASRLTPQFGNLLAGKKIGDVERAGKVYLAIMQGWTPRERGRMTDFVCKDDAARRMIVVDPESPGAQLAELQYMRIAELEKETIIAVRLLTGRKHQIRLQFSDRYKPLLGDRKYGSKRRFPSGVALHSWCLQITHPTQQRRCTWFADLPPSWDQFRSAVPGQQELVSMVEEGFKLQLRDQPAEPAMDAQEST